MKVRWHVIIAYTLGLSILMLAAAYLGPDVYIGYISGMVCGWAISRAEKS